jgi:thioredoxin-dependent peroxiredoxin
VVRAPCSGNGQSTASVVLSLDIFVDAGAEVVGVSGDSVASHEHFAEHHELPFILVSDSGGAIRRLYGVRATLGIWPGRVTFVIDRDGIVRHVFSSERDAVRHVEEPRRTITAAASWPIFNKLFCSKRLAIETLQT